MDPSAEENQWTSESGEPSAEMKANPIALFQCNGEQFVGWILGLLELTC